MPTEENSQEETPLEPQDVNAAEETAADVPVNFDEDGEDPLKRHTKFSWKSFGGDGFIVSVVLHAILIIFALFYVVTTIEPKEEELTEFVSGAGGGNAGENANRQQHRMRPKPRDMSTQNKITSKSTRSTLALPEMPKMNSSMGSMGGMKAGGASSGLGGSAGGGIGSGIGPGIGNGRAFLSAFGSSFSRTPSLRGTLYDLKRSRDGKTTFCTTAPTDAGKRKQELHDALRSLVANKFNTQAALSKKYFAADVKLNANQIYIRSINANAATNAFAGADGKPPFAAPGWLVVYEGEIAVPETGEYRFVGMGDDVLLVGLNREPVLYAYWPGEGHGPAIREPAKANWEPKDHCQKDGNGDASPKINKNDGANFDNMLYKGSWVQLRKGTKYRICVAFGEGAGGLAGAALGIEKKGETRPDKMYSLFKLASIDPEMLEILNIGGVYKTEGPNFMPPRKR